MPGIINNIGQFLLLEKTVSGNLSFAESFRLLLHWPRGEMYHSLPLPPFVVALFSMLGRTRSANAFPIAEV